MTANFTSIPGQPHRFTLMLPGEDVSEGPENNDRPRQGLPHERFLLGEAVPLAPVLLLGQSHEAVDPTIVIACLQPVHLHATRDHLILIGQDQIDLSTNESLDLLNEALPLIEEDFQSSLLFQNSRFWFLSAGPFFSLTTYSVDQAQGRNIDWWMPRDSHEEGIAKRWRKLQNEIQMLWHISPINEERSQRGIPSINSLWISGIGKLNDVQAPKSLQHAQYLIGQHPILSGLAKLFRIPHEDVLSERNLSGAFAWFEQPQLAWPTLSAALLNKQIDELAIIDFPKGSIRERIFTAKDLHKKSWVLWKKSAPLTWNDIAQA